MRSRVPHTSEPKDAKHMRCASTKIHLQARAKPLLLVRRTRPTATRTSTAATRLSRARSQRAPPCATAPGCARGPHQPETVPPTPPPHDRRAATKNDCGLHSGATQVLTAIAPLLLVLGSLLPLLTSYSELPLELPTSYS